MRLLLLIAYFALPIPVVAQDFGCADTINYNKVNDSVELKLRNLYILQYFLSEIDKLRDRRDLLQKCNDKIDAEEELVESSRNLESLIEPRLLSSFKRIRITSRNKVAIVCLNEGACGGCSSKVPENRQNDILGYKKIIVCQYCGRILIDPKLALSVHVFK